MNTMKMEPGYWGLLLPSMLLLSSCWLVVGGQICLTGGSVHMSAVRKDDISPGAKVKWNTTIPPQCIRSVTVYSQFRDNDYTPPNIMQTDEATLSGLLCDTMYEFGVRVRLHSNIAVTSNTVSVHVGVPPTPVNVTAVATANGVVVSWGWNHGLLQCLHKVQVVYQPEGGIERVLSLTNTSATSSTLQNLQYNIQYTLYIRTIGLRGTRARTENALILERGVPTRGLPGGTPISSSSEQTGTPSSGEPSTISKGEHTVIPFGGQPTTTASNGKPTNTPSEHTGTPSGGEPTTISNGEHTVIPSGGQTTTAPSNGKPTTTPSEHTGTPSGGGPTTISNGGHTVIPSGGQTTTAPSNCKPTSTSANEGKHPSIPYPEHCECWPAAGGTIGTVVIISVVISGGLLAVIWNLKRSLNKLQEGQRSRSSIEFPMEQCSAYGKIGHTAYATDPGLVYEVIH